MKPANNSAKRIMRSRAFAFLVAVLVVLAALGLSMGGHSEEEVGRLKAVATASPDILRVGEDLTLSAEGSRGDIVSYQWDTGDGNVLNGTGVVHAYEAAGWYNVTLTVTSKGGGTRNATVLVGVQQEDVHRTRDLGRMRDARPRWMQGRGLLGPIGPNIATPSADLRYSLQRAAGTFQVYVEVWIEEGDRVVHEELHREQVTLTGTDYVFEYQFEPEELDEDLAWRVANNASQIHISAMIDQGRWASGEIVVDVLFPMPLLEVKEA